MSRRRAFLAVALGALAGVPAASAATRLADGMEARLVLDSGLDPRSEPEAVHGSAARAEELLKGSRGASRPAVDLRGGRLGSDSADLGQEPTRPGPSSKLEEPPAPAAENPPASAEPPGKKKRDWGKIIMKWLPIAMFYYASASAIMNPMGTAGQFARGMAFTALLGTAWMLYREARPKKQGESQ